ncbi:hypothetical protein PT974_02035 [Cladobotryum mycophilum]|uniref:Uncharacterized protein n=1 Tax=Cladobotryum mycophilum TaxID=491253 RepID=A0ABR0SY57_9HYPO
MILARLMELPSVSPVQVITTQSPSLINRLVHRAANDPRTANSTREQTIVEAWGQGFNVGALFLLILLVLCNYRRHVLLHKLILLELVLAIWHGIFIFFQDPVYGWVLSSTATALYVSYMIHDLVSWFKIRPFLSPWGNKLFIFSLLLVQPYWILETWANFQYFNVLGSRLFERSRYLEALMRDPWWLFTAIKLVWAIKNTYNYSLISLVHTSPRFGVMLFCVFLSIVFLLVDAAVTIHGSSDSGINPFWRLALVFKCASDVIFLDDFKSVLDHISMASSSRSRNFSYQPHTTMDQEQNSSDQPSSVFFRNIRDSISVPPRAKSKYEAEEQSDTSRRGWADLSHFSERAPDDIERNEMTR